MNTIKEEFNILKEEKKSKFYTYIKPIKSVLEAQQFIELISKKNNDATHNVWAYRVVQDGREYVKYSDDGEPKNTAGKPMSDIIQLKQINNVCIVISRYFGGIKLGAGGLVRAYASAASEVIDLSEKCEEDKRKNVLIDFSYSKTDEVDWILSEFDGEVIEKNYGETISYRAKINNKCEEKLKKIDNLIIV